MSLQEICSALGGILIGLAFIPYVRAIWQTRHLPLGVPGKAEPQKSSWIIWGTLDGILVVGMLMKDAINWQVLIAATGAWVVVVLATKYGKRGWSALDKFCMAGAAFGIVLGWFLRDPTASIAVSLAILFVASIPTFVSAWRDATKENKAGWVIIWLSCVATLLSVEHWTLAEAGQPLLFFAVESIMLFILFRSALGRFLDEQANL